MYIYYVFSFCRDRESSIALHMFFIFTPLDGAKNKQKSDLRGLCTSTGNIATDKQKRQKMMAKKCAISYECRCHWFCQLTNLKSEYFYGHCIM